MKFNTCLFFQHMSKHYKFHLNLTIIACPLHENLSIFMTQPLSFLLRMRNASDKICRATQNTHFTFHDFFFDSRSVYKIMWGNTAEVEGPQITTLYRACALCAGQERLQTQI
jgi:hypothetical protein